ncbi:hypothetical protein ASPWEDRAFT_105391 [Aspergillus wentii DTO 134E9]|uniref:Tyrosine specific protein phosphatases domain-containing protein n=1 Tax=Aspergillus wentii DTO 134E9 TaxID=1073089 RepID=A0A1L9RX49_ASPWE|nr:uncharacterized protein ASPWEDRAFT_105391 [Aspergillus wentii DTO 134E9]KAI9931842.1 hypothetical protein MW887_010426 [Aspergillus wentii]OJJ39473.1 hypothetical protein ASPWEDRAFT_105391 [Aspergillus wentii DTO 134E9]
MGTPDGFSSTSLRSSFSLSGFGPILQYWESIYTAFSSPSAFVSSLGSFQPIDANGSINWGKVVFLTTCFAAMAGCGFLSSMLRRTSTKRLQESRRFRRSAHKNYSKASAETMTSSEDEDYDSNGSLRHGTEGALCEKEAAPKHREESANALTTDPGLLRKHSSYISYTTSVATYPSIRTFFCPHPQMSKFPTKPSPVPLLVFVHGLGGSLAQFNHVLASLSNIGPCFGIDLPGCGRSEFAPSSWDAYTVEALAELIFAAIEKHRDREAGQGVVLVAHSLGCSLSALLASSNSSIGAELKEHVLGLIAVCPRAAPPSAHETTMFRRLLHIPSPIFDLWRRWDRRGGPDSASVARFVGSDADIDTRELQVRYNKQSKTSVWRRMAWGTLPEYSNDRVTGGMPGEEVWAGIQAPVLLVAGESDAITKPEEIQKILGFFSGSKSNAKITTSSSIVPDASSIHDQMPASHDSRAHEEEYGVEPQYSEKDLGDVQVSEKPRRSIKTAILPAPASHALLYDRATYRTLSGIIQDFLCHHVDNRLSLGWQLQYLNTSGKWDVKNLAKWQKVPPMSEPLADTFAALKMLREVDDQHNPVLFSEKNYDRVYAVIDISHESPVYNPASLEKGGIHYYKHPTVSKIPPGPDETRDFIALVDRLQEEITEKMEKRGDSTLPRPLVGVHCHYGFNRTGFLIACYLIERRGFSVQGAIDEFEKRRPPGIRHGHFIDTLFVRYCLGLKRAPTLES